MRKDITEWIVNESEMNVTQDLVNEVALNMIGHHDFIIESDGYEYRFISEDIIWDIYVEEVKQTTIDCYDIPNHDWLVIDWQKTAEKVHVDGYGAQFAFYDGEDIEYCFGDKWFHIFRIN